MSHSRIKSLFLPPKPFIDKELEKTFLSDYGSRYLLNRQTASLIGLFTWTLFVIWDYYHIRMLSPALDHISINMYVARVIGFVSICITLSLMFTSLGRNEYIATIAFSFCSFVCYVLLLYMIVIMPFPYDYLYYYIGLFLVLLFIFVFMRLRIRAICSLLLLLVPLSVLCFYLNNIDGVILIDGIPAKNNSYYWLAATTFLISFVLVGYAISVDFEKSARITFKRENELKEAKASLEQKNDDTFRFLRDASHDLKNPMHALGIHLHLALETINKDDAQAEKYIHTAHLASRTLSRSLHSLLDLTALECGVHPIDCTPFCINNLIEDVICVYQPEAERHNILLRQTPRSKQVAYTKSDLPLLRRVLDNLVSNGIKYSVNKEYRRSFVILDIMPSIEQNSLIIRVIDNGCGIPEYEQENVFKPYSQLHNLRRDRTKGVGLGLSIVKASIARLDNHEFSMTSREGYGTTFIIKVPLDRGDYTKMLQDRKIVENDTKILDGVFTLLVQTEDMLRVSIPDLLKINGALCEVVCSMEELNQMLPNMERPPDIVLTDYRLPNNCSAIDVVKSIEIEFGLDIPVIVATGDSLGESQYAALKRATILKKPISPVELVNSIKSVMRLS